ESCIYKYLHPWLNPIANHVYYPQLHESKTKKERGEVILASAKTVRCRTVTEHGRAEEPSAVIRSRKRLSARWNSPPAPVSCGSSPSRHAPSTRTPTYAASPRASAAALRM